MNREDLLKEMKNTIGTESPRIFFDKMVDVFGLLFDKLDRLEKQLKITKRYAALSINWNDQCAKTMIMEEIAFLRKNGKQPDNTNLYSNEIEKLEYMYNWPIGSCENFCHQWQLILGYHPFLEARDE